MGPHNPITQGRSLRSPAGSHPLDGSKQQRIHLQGAQTNPGILLTVMVSLGLGLSLINNENYFRATSQGRGLSPTKAKAWDRQLNALHRCLDQGFKRRDLDMSGQDTGK